MKGIIAFALCVALAISAVTLSGCSSSGSGSGTPSNYSYTQNDGHLHVYNHRLSDDKYICQLCGKVYTGDPSNLTTSLEPPENDNIPSSVEGVPQKYRSESASEHIGEMWTVVGKVHEVYYDSDGNGQPTFIDIGGEYPNQHVTLIIWGENRGMFSPSPESLFAGKWLDVTGEIYSYDGKPQIEIENPKQIFIIN
jgi:hypothetical protein